MSAFASREQAPPSGWASAAVRCARAGRCPRRSGGQRPPVAGLVFRAKFPNEALSPALESADGIRWSGREAR